LFSPKRNSQPLANEELEDLATQLTQEQQQQEEVPVLQSREIHDLQEILDGSDRYLRRLGDIDPDWEQNCSIRRECSAAALLPRSAGEQASSKANNQPFLF
jgi:hypothetical protein